MFALIYNALLRFFRFGSSANKPASDTAGFTPPLWDLLLQQAKELRNNPRNDSGPLPADEAVRVLERKAFLKPFTVGPSDQSVARAQAAFPASVLEYFRVLRILGRPFPKPQQGQTAENFKAWLVETARTDVPTWVAGLFSGQAITLPAEITDALIQDAANSLGQAEPQRVPYDLGQGFAPYPATQMHVLQRTTRFCVFPQVILCGTSPLVGFPNSTKLFHRDTARRSGWEIRPRWLGPVFTPPEVHADGGEPDAEAMTLTPKTTPQ